MPANYAQHLHAVQVVQMIESNDSIRVVDVRSPAEFAHSRIPNSINVPVSQIHGRLGEFSTGPVVLVCAAGTRAAEASRLLSAAGIDTSVVLQGGIDAWAAHGGELERTASAPWAMERQVRLAAGTLVLIGLLLSLAYDPLKWIAGFIGAGLTFSALSNTCGMARVLSLMPWNRRCG